MKTLDEDIEEAADNDEYARAEELQEEYDQLAIKIEKLKAEKT